MSSAHLPPFQRDPTLGSFVQLVSQLPFNTDRISCLLSQKRPYLRLIVSKFPRQVADRRAPLCVFWGFNGRAGLLLPETLVLRIKLIDNLRGAFLFGFPHDIRSALFTSKGSLCFLKASCGPSHVGDEALQCRAANLQAQNRDNCCFPTSVFSGMPTQLRRDLKSSLDSFQTAAVPTVQLRY